MEPQRTVKNRQVAILTDLPATRELNVFCLMWFLSPVLLSKETRLLLLEIDENYPLVLA